MSLPEEPGGSGQNLLFIVSCLQRGGLELRLLDFARKFPGSYRLHICVTSDLLDLQDLFIEAGARVLVLPIRRAYTEVRSVATLRAYLREHAIGVVNTFDFKGLVIGCLLKLLAGTGFRLIHNTVDLLHSYQRRHRLLLRLLFQVVDRSVCNSEQARELLVSLGIDPLLITVIPNGVDTRLFSRRPATRVVMRERLGAEEGAQVIGTVANFRWEKNYPFLLHAFRLLSQRHPSLLLLCVGAGQCLDSMRALAAELQISDRVHFTGSVANVSEFLNAMDLFVLCSVKESFPNCLLQAMSAEVPVVATDIGACNGLVDDGANGFLFEVNNTECFVARVERLLADSRLARGFAERACRTVQTGFSIDSMIAHYLSLYDSLRVEP